GDPLERVSKIAPFGSRPSHLSPGRIREAAARKRAEEQGIEYVPPAQPEHGHDHGQNHGQAEGATHDHEDCDHDHGEEETGQTHDHDDDDGHSHDHDDG
ncbi:MAG: hypothetical protein ABIF77_18355, partial [bacterium]